jgi:hypothetical protein
MKNQKGFGTVLYVAIIAAWSVGAIGWGVNIYKLIAVDMPLGEFGTMEVMRVIGIFIAPLGAALGFF